MPNYFCFLGPNGAAAQGSTVPFLESEVRYVIKAVQKIQREFIKSMVPKYDSLELCCSVSTDRIDRPDMITAFRQQVDQYFAPTVFSATVRTQPTVHILKSM